MGKEFDFFVRTDLSEYKGLYIAIVGEQVASSGDNAKIVWENAKKKFPDKTPMLAKIPKEDIFIWIVR